MGARGKKSAADLSVVQVEIGSRAEPWPSLNEMEATFWRNIVASLPADWFRASDFPILAAYCQTAAQYEAATDELRGEKLILTASNGRVYRNPLLAVQDTAARRLASLAGKLRLCPSSRYGHRKAFSSGQSQPARKPWEA